LPPDDHCKGFLGCSGERPGSCPVICSHGLAFDLSDVLPTIGQR
jgi:hypothetical protein